MTEAEVNIPGRTIRADALARLNAWMTNLKEPRSRARVGRRLLYALIALLPIHAGLVSIGFPSWWKEVVVWATLLIALTLPARARFERLDLLVVLYLALFVLSAAVHRVSNFGDLSPYFVYVPLAIIVPRLLVTADDVAMLVWVGIAALLFNAAWMGASHLGIVSVPNLLAVDGPQWNTTGSMTGGALATATLYGVASAVAWITAAMSRRPVPILLVGLALAGAGALTGSRAALVASGFGLFIAIAMTAARMRSRRTVGPVLMGVCVVVAIAAILAAPHALRSDDSLRASRWEATLRLAGQNLLLGAGPGATGQSRVTRELGLPTSLSPPDNLIGTRVSESSVLKVAAELGVPAFILMSAWLLSVLIRAGVLRPMSMYGRPYEVVGPTLVILTIVNGVTYQNMESFVGATLFWLGIGLCRGRWSARVEDPAYVPERVRFDPA